MSLNIFTFPNFNQCQLIAFQFFKFNFRFFCPMKLSRRISSDPFRCLAAKHKQKQQQIHLLVISGLVDVVDLAKLRQVSGRTSRVARLLQLANAPEPITRVAIARLCLLCTGGAPAHPTAIVLHMNSLALRSAGQRWVIAA